MAVYFDYPIQFDDDDTIPTVLSWHQNLPILAVASIKQDTGGGIVTLHLDEGEKIDSSNLVKETPVSQLSWHPTRKVLAVAWNNGDLTLWNEYDKEAHEAPSFHKTTVTCMYWNGTGSRLVSGDQAGLLCVWKVDQRGRFQQSPMFQHTLSAGISHLVFKLFVDADVAADIAAATQAAVSGDESALDLFEWQKPGQSKFNISNIESIQMYLGCNDGNIYFLDERGKCNVCFQIEGGLRFIYYYEDKEIIVTINDSLVLVQHTVKDGTYTEVSKFKLNGQPSKLTATSVGSGLIATACDEHFVRVLDIENDQNFVLSLDSRQAFQKEEKVTCLSYNHKQGILAGGTDSGHVIMWQYNAFEDHPWLIQSVSELNGNITKLEWGVKRGLLVANCGSTAVILNQSIMNFHLNEKIAAVQINHNQLSVETFPSCHIMNLKTDIHVKGVYCTKSHIVIWNGKKVAVYEISDSKSMIRAVGTFNSDGQKILLHEMSIYIIEPDKISVRTFQGTVKQELTFLEQEGDPIELNICSTFMVVATTKSVLKVYDLSRREARQVSKSKFLEDEIPNFGSILSVKCNCDATRVAFISQSSNLSTSSFLYIWDAEADSIQCFNFSTGSGSSILDGDLATTQQQLTSSIKGYIPKAIYWDFNEPKLLVCEAIKATKDKNENQSFSVKKEDQLKIQSSTLIVTLFSTPDHGIIVQDHFNTDSSMSGLLGIDLPYYYFVKSGHKSSNAEHAQVVRKSLRDFVGLEDADDSIKKAMSNFSYLSAIGNMDEAFKAIKSIKSGSVWENMARMCVKTKRLDVALVCLGNMGNASAAKAVRESQIQEAELDAHVAMLAIQIGMYVEAEQLYKECQRYDLLNQFYQASNNWKKAIDCAENHDRIHLRTTYYNYGKYLESVGNIDGAIKQYERSDTHHFEVPRMMFEEQDKLEEYISGLQDKTLNQWWAQYLESVGEMKAALRFYERSQDYLAMVRVHCYCGNMENAEEICNNSGDKAACYHLARQFDSNGDVKSAIHYFSRAQAYSNAIRLAKENEMDNELMNLSLLSTPEDMLDCARYFEDKESMEDKAIMLYHKGGRASKAIDLAFKTQQFGALQLISEDLDENADPEVLRRCAEFFIEHDQFEKAVDLLVTANRYEEAIQMCVDHHITLSEEMAERMSVAKGDHDTNTRVMILEKIAECALKQGSFHLATKKFTQAGNKVKAMKSLLKSGDTEKIVFFAGVSRQKEIYVMAANYLQSLDWRKDPEIMKNIIAFYTKGRALESLSSFYDACAQVEIDEFQDYEKAFRALSEAYKTLAKAKVKNPMQQEERLALIKTRLTVMKKFIQAKKEYTSNPDESVKTYEVLLSDPNAELSLQVGDVFTQLVHHYINIRDYHKAYEIIEEMRHRTPNSKIQKFIDIKVIEDIYKSVGIAFNQNMDLKTNNVGSSYNDNDDDDDDEFLEEEIKEEEEDNYVDEDEYI